MSQKATLEMARNISQFALPNITYEDAMKLVKNRQPKMRDEFELSCLAKWVCQFARPSDT